MIQPQTLEIRNGEKIPAIFSKKEMEFWGVTYVGVMDGETVHFKEVFWYY